MLVSSSTAVLCWSQAGPACPGNQRKTIWAWFLLAVGQDPLVSFPDAFVSIIFKFNPMGFILNSKCHGLSQALPFGVEAQAHAQCREVRLHRWHQLCPHKPLIGDKSSSLQEAQLWVAKTSPQCVSPACTWALRSHGFPRPWSTL